MSSKQSLQVLNALLKGKPSKQARKQKTKKNLDAFIRTATKAPVKTGKVEKPKKRYDPQVRRENKKRTNMQKLVVSDEFSQKSRALQDEIVELMRAQSEHRAPKMKKRKARFFDFEDDE
ncbi:hypothetical protein FBU59_001065 [Linderina macrospora]|uniref:Uncharacterized protein n=1 Tax=Linderina macrospora TaxID=4868 RepID=A0ACC1JFB3_9FUNG|nr:hypothetical protein FBU59_001065 [Linderina macrospora]